MTPQYKVSKFFYHGDVFLSCYRLQHPYCPWEEIKNNLDKLQQELLSHSYNLIWFSAFNSFSTNNCDTHVPLTTTSHNKMSIKEYFYCQNTDEGIAKWKHNWNRRNIKVPVQLFQQHLLYQLLSLFESLWDAHYQGQHFQPSLSVFSSWLFCLGIHSTFVEELQWKMII